MEGGRQEGNKERKEWHQILVEEEEEEEEEVHEKAAREGTGGECLRGST